MSEESRKRLVVVAGSVTLSAILAGLAFMLGAWGFDARRYVQHRKLLENMLKKAPRVEQVVDQRGSGLHAGGQVDGADDRLHGVGEDRGLVAASGRLLAATELMPRVGARAFQRGSEALGIRGQRVDGAGQHLEPL